MPHYLCRQKLILPGRPLTDRHRDRLPQEGGGGSSSFLSHLPFCFAATQLRRLGHSLCHDETPSLTSSARTWRCHSVILCLPRACSQLPRWTPAAPLLFIYLLSNRGIPNQKVSKVSFFSRQRRQQADSPGLDSRSITFSKGSDRRHIWHLCPLKWPKGVLASCPSCKAWKFHKTNMAQAQTICTA